MRFTSSGSAIILSRNFSMPFTKSGRLALNAARLPASPVSSTVPSAMTMRIDFNTLSLLACVPQLMPEALLMTIPPTMAEFFEAGSGENTLP